MSRPLRIGTRGSQLALWQANAVAALLHRASADTELVVIRTAGDRLQDAPPGTAGRKGLFVREIDEALLRGDIDVAVHSAKDMPAVDTPGLAVAAALPREDPRDALVLPAGAGAGETGDVLRAVGERPRVATDSVRRSAQLASLLPGATFAPIRGNVDTRLRKLDAGDCDALVLAAAGLRRLSLAHRITVALPVERCVPAPGQGIVAAVVRADDLPAREALRAADDETARVSLMAERTLVAALGGGCQLPLGALAVHTHGALDLHAVVLSPDGARAVRRRASGASSDPAALGRRVADDLVAGGAMEILDAVRR